MRRMTRSQAAATVMAPPSRPLSSFVRIFKASALREAPLKKTVVAPAKEDTTAVKELLAPANEAAPATEPIAPIKEQIASVKEQTVSVKEETASVKEQTASQPKTPTRKRKAATLAQEEEECTPQVTKRTVSIVPSSKDEEPQSPVKRSRRDAQPPPKTPRSSRNAVKTPAKTPRNSRKAGKTPAKGFQSKLEDYNYTINRKDDLNGVGADLLRLHAAFLKTLLLHIAHSGRNAPVEITSVAPNISRNWGKRAVTVDDIRRCVAIEGPDSPFILADYGRSRVCVELGEEWIRDATLAIHEDRLSELAEEEVHRIGAERLGDVALSDLPLADVVDRDCGVIKASPLLAKGRRALSELKQQRADKQQRKPQQQDKQQDETSQQQEIQQQQSPLSLLDRIRHKQLARANEPPPSSAQLERRAALNRIADVAATISMLSLANPAAPSRQAFTMALVSDKLRDSLRVPISKEEGMACIRLIAVEIAPEWFRIVFVGGRETVVIQSNAQPVDRVLHDRVQMLLA